MKFFEPYLSGNSFMNDGILNLKVMYSTRESGGVGGAHPPQKSKIFSFFPAKNVNFAYF
jgi:hypothetical protein